MQVHLSQQVFSLATQLRYQQMQGEMTDTVMVCEKGERIAAHGVVLATHWMWGYLLRELKWREEKLSIVMTEFAREEVEQLVREAYNNIDMDDTCRPENKVREIVKIERESSVKDSDVSEYKVDEDENVDDSIVDISEHFDIANLVKTQIMLHNKAAEEGPVGFKHSRSGAVKDKIFKACYKVLENSVEHCESKVRGLPLHGFVFTDEATLELARRHVRRERVDVKVAGEESCEVIKYLCVFGDCDFGSEERQESYKHVMDIHTEQGAYVCKGCERRFSVRDRAYRHIQTEHVIKQIKNIIKENVKVKISCHLCEKVFKKEAGLRDHLANVHEKQKDLKCPECKFVSKDYLEVKRHRSDEHGHGHRACDICGRQFTSRVGFDHHMKNTHGDGMFPCEDCGEVYKTKRALEDHRKKHMPKTCICEECGASFHTPFGVKKHKRMHGTEFPFPCNLCDKKFRDARPLKEHMYKHTGERPYLCKKCNATFNQHQALNRHERVVHAGIRAFPCVHCSFRGGQAYDLVRHMKTIHQMESSSLHHGINASS